MKRRSDIKRDSKREREIERMTEAMSICVVYRYTTTVSKTSVG